MLDIVSNVLQMAALCVCEAFAFYDARSKESRLRLLYGLFLFSFFMGDLWWLLDISFFGETPVYSLIPYLNWKASGIFIILMMMQYNHKPVLVRPTRAYIWAVPVFCAAMCAFFMQYGAYVDNILTAVLMSAIISMAIQRLEDIKENVDGRSGDKMLCQVVLLFSALEYAMWASSCLSYENLLRYIYYVFEFGLTVCILLFIPAIRKAVSE